MKSMPVCYHCKSKDVSLSVSAFWNPAKGMAEVEDIHDKGHYCPDCDGETRLEWVEIDEPDVKPPTSAMSMVIAIEDVLDNHVLFHSRGGSHSNQREAAESLNHLSEMIAKAKKEYLNETGY